MIGGVINTGHIGGKLDLKATIRGIQGSGERRVVGGIINTGYISGGLSLESDIGESGGNSSSSTKGISLLIAILNYA